MNKRCLFGWQGNVESLFPKRAHSILIAMFRCDVDVKFFKGRWKLRRLDEEDEKFSG